MRSLEFSGAISVAATEEPGQLQENDIFVADLVLEAVEGVILLLDAAELALDHEDVGLVDQRVDHVQATHLKEFKISVMGKLWKEKHPNINK